MLKSDLRPPQEGLNADPVLYGVAAVLAELFPPLSIGDNRPADTATGAERDREREQGERD